MRLIVTVAILLLPLAATADDTKLTVKEFSLANIKLERAAGRIGLPVEITDDEDLAKVFPDKTVRDKLKKEADPSKFKLVYFAWSGSGQDKLTYKISDGEKKQVNFVYTPGRSRDLREHHRLFAVPVDVPVKLGQ
jgi:hypothetical protein